MRTITLFSLFALVLAGMHVTAVRADSFDDAVNLYLKGFDHCSAAKAALGNQDVNTARSEFGRYESVRQQAARMDPSILGSSRRGMDSNLKYCARVGTDIEIEVGKPMLEQALVACDKAVAHLEDGQVEPARAEYQQFITLRDQALQTAPALGNVFSLRSEIRRCERLDSKIASFGQRQAAVTGALQLALEASETFQAGCAAALEEVSRAALDESAIDAGRKAQGSAQSLRKEASDELAALKTAANNTLTAEQATIEGRIARGNQCLAQLETTLVARERQVKAAQEAVNGYIARLNQANAACAAIRTVPVASVSRGQYDQARAGFEAARKTRDELKTALASAAAPEGMATRRLDGAMRTLDSCLEQARPQLNALLAALSAPAVTATVPRAPKTAATAAPAPAAVRKPGIPALEADGTLEITDILPDFALVYWLDGSEAPAQVDVLIHPTRFDQPVYILRPGGTLQFRSDDFAAHTIAASVNGANPLQAQIKSRQRRSAETVWPNNSIAVLRSDQSRVAQSYVVSIASGGHTLLRFDSNSKQLAFRLKNPGNATKGFVLMPDYDPVAFEIGQGDELRVPVTRNGATLGSLVLKGN